MDFSYPARFNSMRSPTVLYIVNHIHPNTFTHQYCHAKHSHFHGQLFLAKLHFKFSLVFLFLFLKIECIITAKILKTTDFAATGGQ